ncbi:hypothetical protein BACOVA_04647 [Bacteroides ovatus ATCC 8483]|uniref:Uncharacterized protein n=1 Tax=Bacteroides ovatus (strain ATCC 8483 / DSM 1896 / JCM 5824 / BCRC 10623 / CCUG 4943 / NCTC 11153) TaxID=411476 RepID=A0AAN3A1X2_BACO1|nr:hypothetical protein BACOVA_04647 [Bacteroides ovatus ATCC 8483]
MSIQSVAPKFYWLFCWLICVSICVSSVPYPVPLPVPERSNLSRKDIELQ